MKNLKPILFVDFENCPHLDRIDVSRYQRIILFISSNASKVTFPDTMASQLVSFDIFRVSSTGRNNLDFHIAMFIGAFDRDMDTSVGFEILSKDKGFDGIVSTLSAFGRRPAARIEGGCCVNSPLGASEDDIGKVVGQVMDAIKNSNPRMLPATDEKLFNWVSSRNKSLTISQVNQVSKSVKGAVINARKKAS